MPQLIRRYLSKSFWPKNRLLYSPDLAPNDLWLFPKMRSALKGRRVLVIDDIQKKTKKKKQVMTALEAVRKMFPKVAAL
jgi:hypoxanthine-guanine phosphoribosyltransferase